MDMVTYGILSKRINGILSGVKSTEVQGLSLIHISEPTRRS